MPAISVLMKPSSGLCNMSCDYCFYQDESRKRDQESFGFMSERTVKNIIRRTMLRAEGGISYIYQGGEPTLRGLPFFQKALEYQRQYNRSHIQVHNAIQTNGYALNEEWCRFLKENQFLVGVSLDGTKDIHDNVRRNKSNGGTFERVLANIRLLEKYQVDFNILTVVTEKAAENITEIYEYYRKNQWHYQQYIACLDPLGEAHGGSRYALHPHTYGKFLTDLFFLWYQDWKRGKQPYIRQFDNYIGILLGCCPEACDQIGTCSNQYVVEADGSVYPCDFYMLDQYCLGNFNSDQLEKLDEKRLQIKFREESMQLTDGCRKCRWHFLCRGGCMRNRDKVPGMNVYQNYFCESYRFFFDSCYEQMKEVAASVQ